MSPRTGWVWVARALVASAACVLLAVGAHALGGGVVAAADPFLLTGMALPLALAATRVRWSTGRAVAALGVEAEADGDVDGEVGVEELPQAAVRESRAAAASARGRCMVMCCPS